MALPDATSKHSSVSAGINILVIPGSPSSSTADRAAEMIRQMESGLPTGRPFSALVGDAARDNLRVTSESLLNMWRTASYQDVTWRFSVLLA